MKKFFKKYKNIFTISFFIIIITFGIVSFFFFYQQENAKLRELTASKEKIVKDYQSLKKDFSALKSEDQYVINQKNKEEIKNIQDTYKKTVTTYENLIKLQEQTDKTDDLEKLFVQSLTLLSQKNYASSDAILTQINTEIEKTKTKIASEFSIPKNVPTNNVPPSAGFSQQQVSSDVGAFLVDIISADLASTKVIVDTASDGDCKDNCPVLPLSDYVSRSGAYAGINGSFFCPTAYPSCAGKTNSFDLLVMNKNKHYFNSDNNVYSTNPAVIFGGSWVRFVGRALEWGRDTGVDGVLSNFPMLVNGGNVAYSDNPDPKFNSKGPRNFVANKGNTVYIGTIFNATMGDAAHVLKTMGMDNAMNLDEGGSTALWYGGGYKVGPGRNVPNAILFVRK